MKKLLQIVTFTFFSVTCFGQIGLINDLDGYTNVRKEKSADSEILFQIKENEVFFIDVYYVDLDSSWIKIWFPKSKYSKYNKDYSNSDLNGYIHKSRIRLIDSLRVCEKDCPKLIYGIQKADSTRELENGVFGLEIPLSMSYEVSSLYLKWDNQTIQQNTELYDDLLNVAFEEGNYTSDCGRFTTYENNGTYFIRQKCADGAGYYEIIWVVKNGEIIQRLAGWIT
ncbi:MAG: hypothetical protein NXI09_10075 [Bacteroidetes bacterium]|nr:hypothetical protein [Bacteroidota bacterium]